MKDESNGIPQKAIHYIEKIIERAAVGGSK
jgi:hypothetical protein